MKAAAALRAALLKSYFGFALAGAVKRRKAALLALRPPQAAHGGRSFRLYEKNQKHPQGGSAPLRIL